MSRQSYADVLKYLFNLFLAWNHKRGGRLERARRRLDNALHSNNQPDSFALAFDGLLMIGEGHMQGACQRFLECLECVAPALNADDQYVALYCQFWLNMCDEKMGYEEILSSALKANEARPSSIRTIQNFLPRLRTDKLKEICGDREPRNIHSGEQGWATKFVRREITFDF